MLLTLINCIEFKCIGFFVFCFLFFVFVFGIQMKGNRNKIKLQAINIFTLIPKEIRKKKLLTGIQNLSIFLIKNCLIIYFSYFQLKEELLLNQLAKKACSKKLRWSNLGTHKPLNFDQIASPYLQPPLKFEDPMPLLF